MVWLGMVRFGYFSLGLDGLVGFRFGLGWVTVRSRSFHGQFKFSSQSGHGEVRSGDGQVTDPVMSGHGQFSGQGQVTFISGHDEVTVRPPSRSRSRSGHGHVTVRLG